MPNLVSFESQGCDAAGQHYIRGMCNHALRERHMLKHATKVIVDLEVPEPEPEFTLHAYPKSPSPIIVQEDGRRRVETQRWGIGYEVNGKPTLVTNARDDQLLKIRLWRESTARRRCLIPVVGYFEPGLGPPGMKGELFFTLKERPVFFIAGLWEPNPDGSRAYAMVTTSPNAYTTPFHDRQPVVLSDTDCLRWLGSEPIASEEVHALTRPPPADAMMHEVIPAVPKAKKETSESDGTQGMLF